MDKLVSIIVPVYKVERDLQACIDSLVNQTYRNIEIILVDDGSPDRCGEICDDNAKQDQRIVVVHKENGGQSDARNEGIKISKGDYITFVDSDDVVELTYVQTLLALCLTYNAEIAVCQNSVFNYTLGVVYSKNPLEEKCFSSKEAVTTMLYQKKFETCAWGKLYLRHIWDDLYFPQGMIYEDLAICYKALLRSKKVAYTSKELYRYQIRENSTMTQKFSLKKMDGIQVADMLLKDIQMYHPDFLLPAKSRYIAQNFHILAQIPNNIPEKKMIQNNIKKVRISVILDKRARIRVRCACIMSFISFDLTMYILNKLNKHKYF